MPLHCTTGAVNVKQYGVYFGMSCKLAQGRGEVAKLRKPEIHRELKLTIAAGLTFGTADFVAISGKHGILMDWKFGWGSY